jgi:hypothetical protein
MPDPGVHLGGLVAAGLVVIEETSFEKDGRVIPFERAESSRARADRRRQASACAASRRALH